MKSMIRMALLGLFVAAPSVMAWMPTRNAPARLDGIYINIQGPLGLNVNETKALKNGFGLWLQNMGSYKLVSSPTDPDRLITVNIQKIDAANPAMPSCSNPKNSACILDIQEPSSSDGYTANIKYYAKYSYNGVTQYNPNRTDIGFLQNLMTNAIGVLFDVRNSSAIISSGTLDIPSMDACDLSTSYAQRGASFLYCQGNGYVQSGLSRSDNGVPVLEFTRYNSAGQRISREFGVNLTNSTGLKTGLGQIGQVLLKSDGRSDFYILETAKWVFPATGSATATLSQARIQLPGSLACYESLDGTGKPRVINFWQTQNDAINYDPYAVRGAASPLTKLSWSFGDALSASYPSTTCATFMGHVGTIAP